MHVKKGDNIIVTTGKHKGAKGTIAKILGDRVIVEGVNKVTRHVRAKNRNEKGTTVEVEASLHHSNVALVQKKSKESKSTKKA